MKKKIKQTEFIELEFDSNKLIFTKPSELTMKAYHKLVSKSKLSKHQFRRFALYYAQQNYNSKSKINFLQFENISHDDIGKIFLEYIRSDEKLVLDYNDGQEINNADGAEFLLRKYLDLSVKSFLFLVLGVFLQISIPNLWIESLKGEFSEENAKLLNNLSSTFSFFAKNYPQHCEIEKDVYKHLLEFDNFKKSYIENSKKFSTIIERVRSAKLWIPYRFLERTFSELTALKINKVTNRKISEIIFKPFKPDFEKVVISD